MRRHLLAITACLALAACGDDSKTSTTTVTDAGGSKVTVKTETPDDGATRMEAVNEKGEKIVLNIGGSDVTWPADAPAYAPAYPGGKVTSTMASSADGKTGSITSFETSDPVETVIDFYRSRARKAGLDQVQTVTANSMDMVTASDGKGRELMIQANKADGKTIGSLVLSRSTKG